jgi:acetyl esterase/lipase
MNPKTTAFAVKLAPLLVAVSLLGCGTARAGDPATVVIWPDGPPGGQSVPTRQTVTERSQSPEVRDRFVTGITDPSLALFRPENPNGMALLMAPGGGYQRVVLDKEGYETAEWFAARGVTAFVLLYRLPDESWSAGPNTPLQDTQRAMRWIRHHAADFGLDPSRIGVVGFSAGGHAAATLLTRFDETVYEPLDEVDRQSARPDFGALIYPVISLSGRLAHEGSRERLLGADYHEADIRTHSPERQVGPDTPPVFLLHAADDEAVPAENSIVMYRALRDAGVCAELHLFAEGGHGFGLRYVAGKPVAAWPELLLSWMKTVP